jgi:hypothetical protein
MKILRKLCCEQLGAADGRQVHVNCGGARAWAMKPARAPGKSGAWSRQITSVGWR